MIALLTSAGFSIVAMVLATRMRFSQVILRLMMWTPSILLLKMYCSIVVSLFSDPMWVVAANLLVISSS